MTTFIHKNFLFKIRQETFHDYDKVHAVIKEAFADARHSDGCEHLLVKKLRKSASFIAELSLVAAINTEIAGHILFTKAQIGTTECLALAPLSVLPKYQKQGIGTSLINAGHAIAENLGYPYSVVLGSPDYYPKFGYTPAVDYGIILPKCLPAEYLFIKKLTRHSAKLSGKLGYPAEFGIEANQ